MIRGLLELLDNKELATIVLTQHLGDLLAGLIQLSFAPLKKPDEPNEAHDKLVEDQAWFRTRLDSLAGKIYQPMVMKYLLVLQSSGAKESTGLPKWLLTACGTLMTHRLVASSLGVVNLVKAVLEIGTPQAQTADLKKVEVVASIVSNPTTSGSLDFKRIDVQFRSVKLKGRLHSI